MNRMWKLLTLVVLVLTLVLPTFTGCTGDDIASSAGDYEAGYQYASSEESNATELAASLPTLKPTKTPKPTPTIIKSTKKPKWTPAARHTKKPKWTPTVRPTKTPKPTPTIRAARTPKPTRIIRPTATNRATRTPKPTRTPKSTAAYAASSKSGSDSGGEVSEDGQYTEPEDVALYLHTYGHLPDNFITKSAARKLGWDNSKGNLWDVAPGKSIGGDHFGNYEGVLPDAKGRRWYECDVKYKGGYRGKYRILYSSDGLIYYSDDHYSSAKQLY